MSDWTPTTDEVLEDYRDARIMGDRDPAAEFDRWLKQVKAEAWDEGASSVHDIYGDTVEPNPYRKETDA